jgi:hypothetical protein
MLDMSCVEGGPVTSREFHVEDLRYEHSMVRLRRQLQRCPGIQDVATDPGTSIATISFAADRWNAKDLERLITECGYVYHRQSSAGTA